MWAVVGTARVEQRFGAWQAWITLANDGQPSTTMLDFRTQPADADVQAAAVAYWLIERIADGTFTDTQVRNAFGLTVTQYNAMKARMQTLHDQWAGSPQRAGRIACPHSSSTPSAATTPTTEPRSRCAGRPSSSGRRRRASRRATRSASSPRPSRPRSGRAPRGRTTAAVTLTSR
jgi:hypothetical protein